ncbi:MAG: sensor histidine kinase [Hyphomicrobium sp.]
MSSLRIRLLIVWAVFIALTLTLTDFGLRFLFERSITRRTHSELEADLRQVRRGMETRPGGEIVIVREPTDPQFDMIFGGRYWQVAEGDKILVRSASLGGISLPAPSGRDSAGLDATHTLTGPQDQRLFAVVRKVEVFDPEADKVRALTITAAVDVAEIGEDTNMFNADLHAGLGVLAAFLLLGSWAHVAIGLQPLELLRERLAAVRAGQSRTIEGIYPDEVMPLVDETNALLAAQEEQLRAARDRAGDLAHGLKTPLAVMLTKSRQLKHNGQEGIATEIDRQISDMNRHVERELARVRTRGASVTEHRRADVAALTEALVSIIQGLPRGQNLEWRCDLPARLDLAVDAEDFNTMAGNLLENAQKWAQSQISVTARKSSEGAELIVEDDGPGIPDGDIARVLQRGERADETVSGSGLGLAIVSDTVALYKGSLVLSRSGLGGLKALVSLPG